MKLSHFLGVSLLGWAAASPAKTPELTVSAIPAVPLPPERPPYAGDPMPNLLFIITDQQRADALGIVGKVPFLQTPNLDELARNSVMFTRAYTPVPVSVPARAGMLTGLAPYSKGNGIIDNNNLKTAKEGVDFTAPTFDNILYNNGYDLEYFGKWHVPNFPDKINIYGFDFVSQFLERPNGGIDYRYHANYVSWVGRQVPSRSLQMGEQLNQSTKQVYRPSPIDPWYGLPPNAKIPHPTQPDKFWEMSMPDFHGESLLTEDQTLCGYTVSNSIRLLKKASKSGRPFALTCSINEPHPPVITVSPYFGMYPPEEMIPPPSIADDMKNAPYATYSTRQETLFMYSNSEKIKHMISAYYGMVTMVDHQVGKLLDALKETGQYDNTMIIFVSDHGEMMGSHGMVGKFVLYEESIGVPLIISYPGKIKPGTVVDEPVSTLALFPTIMDYFGIKDAPGTDANSLRPLIEGTHDKTKEVYQVSERSQPAHGEFAVITKEWKLIASSRENTSSALYNLMNDPYEMNNLIGQNPNREEYKERVNILKVHLVEYMERVNHPKTVDIKRKDLTR